MTFCRSFRILQGSIVFQTLLNWHLQRSTTLFTHQFQRPPSHSPSPPRTDLTPQSPFFLKKYQVRALVLYIFLFLFFLSLYLSVLLFLSLSLCFYICFSLFSLLSLSLSLCLYLFFSVSLSLSFCMSSLSLTISFSLSLSLSFSLSLIIKHKMIPIYYIWKYSTFILPLTFKCFLYYYNY